MKLTLLVVAPMHALAEQWARQQGLAQGSYKTVTSSQYLRGYCPSFPITLLDMKVRFSDSRVLQLINTRFTNVTRISC